jgi:hypothetical protein
MISVWEMKSVVDTMVGGIVALLILTKWRLSVVRAVECMLLCI